MSADGTWNVTIDTPMGQRQSTLELATSGGALTGTQSAEGNKGAITDGTVKGDDVSWKIAITDPMPMTLEFTGTVAGDSLSGTVALGAFGSFPFSGSRA